jgi:hydroxyethylthiazole kinase-like uncharacterized protein yjeF
MVIGGARATPGAAMLGALAAMRVGGGHLTLGVAESVAVAVAVAVPESGVVALSETPSGAVRGAGAEQLAGELETMDAVLIGPGLSDPDETSELIERATGHLGDDTKVVLDAQALISLSQHGLPDLKDRLVLTPNVGEAKALLSHGSLDPDSQPIEDCAVEIARRHDAVVCLQGVVAAPDGHTWMLSTGNPGLATSGSGDVLAGAVAGLLGRGAEPTQAAGWGTYLHAAAGDRLTARVGATGFLAREVLDELPGLLVELLAARAD